MCVCLEMHALVSGHEASLGRDSFVIKYAAGQLVVTGAAPGTAALDLPAAGPSATAPRGASPGGDSVRRFTEPGCMCLLAFFRDSKTGISAFQRSFERSLMRTHSLDGF